MRKKSMKIYISLPISGRDIEEVEARCVFATGVIEKKGHTAVSPLEVSPDTDAPYSTHMGNDIAALLECNAVLFLDGWQESKGCQLEHRAAELYGKIVYYTKEVVYWIYGYYHGVDKVEEDEEGTTLM